MAEIILDKINYTYSDGTAYEIQALKDVNLQIHQGEFIGIIGHTGSGKSTLTQLLNGLLRASSGSIYVDGQDIYDEGYDMKALRSKWGWFSSIRIISCLRPPVLRMSVLDKNPGTGSQGYRTAGV